MKTLSELVKQIKSHTRYHEAGMILCHNGIVRNTSRDGRKVKGLSLQVDWDKLREIIAFQKKRAGILDILVEINEEQDLKIGDDVMYLVVAGDIRETVISTLSDTLNEIKSTVTSKKEFFLDN